ncbi:glycosyltransferase [Sphingomonas sp. RHCKR7]|uniref:glycosyltransferase n=1 Tax=Sphingomonas folli TaxID=2862497 RepID=UPI001CA4B83D|nr:glycosyltransferase [Sphingomonas folli]MBW6528600.1 glycosyltransferase [Sphingomonas folli]
MRVLHVITGLDVGGAETMLARLLEHGRRHPHLCAEVLSLITPGRGGERIAATGTPMGDLGMAAGMPSPRALLSLARAIAVRRPDVILAWMHHAQLAATLAAALARPWLRVPVIWNVRHSVADLAEEKPLTRLVLRAQAALSGGARAIVYNSHAAADQYRRLGFRARDQRVIPNGFDLVAPQPRAAARALLRERLGVDGDGDGLLIGMVARAAPMKDAPNLLRAVALARAQGLAARALLVGKGMDEDPALAPAAYGLPADSVIRRGHRADVAEWLGGLDLLALPSAWGEGFPNVVGEAMLAGVPCVATDVGDSAALIGDTGAVVPPRDPAALAGALVRLGALPTARREALGERARERVRARHDIRDVVDRYAALYRDAARSAEASRDWARARA